MQWIGVTRASNLSVPLRSHGLVRLSSGQNIAMEWLGSESLKKGRFVGEVRRRFQWCEYDVSIDAGLTASYMVLKKRADTKKVQRV